MKARENPFRIEKVAGFRYRIEAERLTRWRDELLANSRPVRWSIVGPMGTGKTVLMEDLARLVPDHDWVKIHDDDTPLTKWRASLHLYRRSQRPLFLDGSEALPRWCLFSQAVLRPKLVLTLHRPRKQIHVLHRTSFDPDVLLNMVESFTNVSTTPAQKEHILRLAEKHKGNVREVLRELYHRPLSTALESSQP